MGLSENWQRWGMVMATVGSIPAALAVFESKMEQRQAGSVENLCTALQQPAETAAFAF